MPLTLSLLAVALPTSSGRADRTPAPNAAAGDGANASAVAPRCAGHVSSGYEHSCAITATGALLCWGSDDHGQLNVPPGYRWATVSAGKYHTCGVTTSATLICWGRDKHHEAETLVTHSWAAVSAGSAFTCAVTTTGRLACWGDNHYGEADVPPGVFTDVSAGFGDTVCALETSKAIACWGKAADGQTGVPPGYEWSAVSTGWLHACGLAAGRRPGAIPADSGRADEDDDGGQSASAGGGGGTDGVGAIICWGNNDFGQLDVPQLRPREGSRWVSVAAGHSYTCGVTDAGALRCWGHLPFGLERVPPGVRWAEVSAGYYHVCGYARDGRLRCWGLDYDGQAEVPEGFDFSAACARAAVPAEHKPGRGGCPARQLAHTGDGYSSRAAVVAECQRVGCAYYVWAQPAEEDGSKKDAGAGELAGHAWFCRDDYYDSVGNGRDWPGWEVGRLKLGCNAVDGDVRLSSYPRGEVYVYEAGVWTTLCGELDLPTAGVLCRQLGYERAALTYTYWGQEYAYLGVHAPSCGGGERSLRECEQREVNCVAAGGHKRDQGIECAGGRAAASGGPPAAECGTAPIARHAHATLGQTLGAGRGGELAERHEHHGRTVAPTDLALRLAWQTDAWRGGRSARHGGGVEALAVIVLGVGVAAAVAVTARRSGAAVPGAML